MRDDLTRRLPLTRMAQLVNLSTARLSYLFKHETGMSPSRYLKSLRMREAEILLLKTFLSIKEITARVGFADESHFVRDFKKLYGTTPTDYRKRNQVITEASRETEKERKDRLMNNNNRQ